MSDSDDDAAFASADEGDFLPPPLESHGATAAPVKQEVKPKVEEKLKVEEVKKKEPEKLKNETKGKKKKKKKGKNASKSSSEEKMDAKSSKVSQNTKTSDSKIGENKSSMTTEKDEERDEDAETDKITKTENADKSKTNVDIKSTSDCNKPDTSKDSTNIQTSREDLEPGCKQTSTSGEDNKKIITESPRDETIPRQLERDHTSVQEEIPDKLTSTTESESSGGWGWGWGSSLLKTASSSVSTLKNQVGDGFTTLMDTVETTLGAPSPEEMAEKSSQKTQQPVEKTEVLEADGKIDRGETTISGEVTPTIKEREVEEKGNGWFTNISSIVQNTVTEGIGVLETIGTGGLDVMEKIGKKTYSVITEHDPGFRKARQFLGNKGDKPNLSVVLREAKEDADRKMEIEKESEEARQSHFGCLFDDYQGVAHLEALEILSNQSERKVQALLHTMSDECIGEIKPQLMTIKDVFEIDENDEEDEHDFVKLVTEQLVELHLGTTPDKLNKTQEKARKWLEDFNMNKKNDDDDDGVTDTSRDPKEIHKVAIQSLAELTSKSVEQFHKAGELILLQKDTEKSYLTRAKALASLTQVLCSEVGILATKFVDCLNQLQEKREASGGDVNPLVTNIYLQASNSASYLQDSFQLLLPVLQQAVIQNSQILQ